MFSQLKSIFIGILLVTSGAGAVFFVREWALSQVSSQVPSEIENSSVEEVAVAPSTSSQSNSGPLLKVVVSSDMESGGDCHDHYTEGCDLFALSVDLSTGEVTELEQLTDNEVADINPVLSQDGTMVYYTESNERGDVAMEISIDGGAPRVLSTGASCPFPTPDGTQVYATSTKGFYLSVLSLNDSTAVFEKLEGLMSTHEPQVSSTGLIGFYRSTLGSSRGSNTSQAMLYIPATGKTVEVSEADGTAHCFWNYDGSALYCNNAGDGSGGILSFPVSEDAEIGAPSVAIRFPTFASLGKVDSQFDEDCVTTSVQYGSFCDETHVLLTAACYTANMVDGEREQEFTQTVILDLDSGEYLALGAHIAEAYGSATGTTWTGSCVSVE